MMIEQEEGDMFSPDWGLTALGHGCNALGVMGAGVASDVRTRYPGILRAYQSALRTGTSLGEFHLWSAPAHQVKWVYNLVTQPTPGPCADPRDITRAVGAMIANAQHRGFCRVGVPMIGSGLGGLRHEESLAAIMAAVPLDGPGTLVIFTKFLKGVGRPVAYAGVNSERTSRGEPA